MKATATVQVPLDLSFEADRFSWKDWNRFCDLELKLNAHNSEWLEDELRLCALPIVNEPSVGFLYWLPRYWKLVDKKLRVRRCVPNRLQRFFLTNRHEENIILKYRKGGASTIIDALYYWRCLFSPNKRAVIMAHENDSTEELFQDRVMFGHEHLPGFMKPRLKRSSKKELRFSSNGSRLRVLTAGGRGLGRAGDADMIHLSEFAHYPAPWKVLAGLGESAREDALLDIESTPNGWNEFREVFTEARDDPSSARVAFFFPWYLAEDNIAPVNDPIEFTEEERLLVDTLNLSESQIAWRRIKERNLGELRRQEHPEDDESCFISSGSPKFPRDIVRELRLIVQEESEEVDLRGVGPYGSNDNGRLIVWELPRPGARYIIGADVAEGVPKGNFSAIGVLDVDGPEGVPEQVAAWVGRIGPNDFAYILAELGVWYNKALVAVERNNHGHSTLATLKREIGYPRLYKHREYNQRRRGTKKVLGWPTNAATRPPLIDDIRDAIVRSEIVVRHDRFLAECLSFQSGDEFKTERDEADQLQTRKRYNDTIFAWGIALQVRKRGSYARAA